MQTKFILDLESSMSLPWSRIFGLDISRLADEGVITTTHREHRKMCSWATGFVACVEHNSPQFFDPPLLANQKIGSKSALSASIAARYTRNLDLARKRI